MRHQNLLFVAMILGAGLGLLRPSDGIVWWCDLFGTTIFIGALRMIVAPLILFSILAGITSLADQKELWAIGWRSMLLYLVATAVAVMIGLIVVLAIRPGERGARDEIRASWSQRREEIAREESARERKVEAARKLTPKEAIRENIRQIVTNPFEALANANSLGIIFFAALFGAALMFVRDKAGPVIAVIDGCNAAMLQLTRWIMAGAPFFIFCLIASLVAKHGPAVFHSLFWYVITVLLGIACHVGFLLTLVRVIGRMSPVFFLKGIRRAWAVAFATRSSAATLPVTIECVERELKVPRKIVDFVAPIGATIGMTGTALYEGVAVIFLIQLFGGLPGAEIHLGAVTTVIVFLTAVLAAVGAAAVPDAGLVTMVLVANAVGLDVQYIALIFAVDAFLDMFRTSTNVMDDAVVSVAVARLTAPPA
ncbi:MAG TPA: dicarboxylate/amino acid:cation symporter [Planctomycetota bacterium]|nr:dicarboxylate/amino acid:cation symporter [Planctomycetota bacterium]